MFLNEDFTIWAWVLEGFSFSWQDAEFSISKFLSKIVIFRTEIWYIEWLIGSYPIPGCTIH